VLGVSRSSYYAWSNRPQSRRKQQDEELSEQIHTIYQDSRGCYGSPRIHNELQVQGVRCSQKRVARLMQGAPTECLPAAALCDHYGFGSWPSHSAQHAQPPVSSGGGGWIESGVGRGHHLHSHSSGMAVSGCSTGPEEPPRDWLGHEPLAGTAGGA
jgi:hypothetical protein